MSWPLHFPNPNRSGRPPSAMAAGWEFPRLAQRQTNPPPGNHQHLGLTEKAVTTGRQAAATMLNKVPEVTLAFWIIKILSTTVGETGADYLAVHVGLGTLVTDAVMLVLLAASLAAQVSVREC